MEAKDKLVQAAIFGKLADDESKLQTGHVSFNTLEPAAIQLGGALICIQNAIDELEKIPDTSGWLLLFFLRMIAIQLTQYEKQLRGE